MSKPVVLGIVLLVAVLGFLIWSSLGLQQHRVEVCMTYEGKQVCRVAQGPTKDAALRQAMDNACAMLTSGVTGTVSCLQRTPDQVRWLSNE
jgi:hypothetical protein